MKPPWNPEPRRILLIRLRQIGDVVFTTPLIRALRERFGHAHIAYLVEPAAAPVVARNPHLDEVMVVPRRQSFREDLRLIGRLRRERFELAIDLHGGPRASTLAWLSGAPMRIGYEIVARSWMYTHRVARARPLRARHSVRNQWDLLAPLDIASPDPERFPVEMSFDASTSTAVAARLRTAGLSEDDRVIVLHVSAGNPFRRWPLDHFAAVAAGLVASDDRRVVITSGPSERDAAQSVIDQARAHLPAHSRDRVLACGELSLPELRALVEGAALYIGGDSGPLHIAATSAVPIVAIFGPTLEARSLPWRSSRWVAEAVHVDGLPCRPCDQRVCQPGDFRCLTSIPPTQVLEAAERTLILGLAPQDPGTRAPTRGRSIDA